MGDKHVCSCCALDQAGKQHVKVVYENWPVEEPVTARRKTGPPKTTTRKRVQQVVSVIGMECLADPERWAGFPIEPEKVAAFFDRLRTVGKNPIFMGVLVDGGLRCLSTNCLQRMGGQSCQHVQRWPTATPKHDELSCYAGHPGVTLVPREQGTQGSPGVGTGFHTTLSYVLSIGKSWKTLLRYCFKQGPGYGLLTILVYGVPFLLAVVWWTVTAPLWLLAMALKR